MKPSQESYVPSHPNLFVVEFSNEEYSSCLRASKNYNAGETIALIEDVSRGPKAYTSVQCGLGPDDHVELNSDLVYVNHSCKPNVAFDLSSPDLCKWHVRALEDIQVGTTLTFFYPSTEWDMDQPFDCQCNTDSCLKRIQGAAYLSREELNKRKFINSYIWVLVNQRDGYELETGDKTCLSCGYGSLTPGDQRCGCKPTNAQ